MKKFKRISISFAALVSLLGVVFITSSSPGGLQAFHEEDVSSTSADESLEPHDTAAQRWTFESVATTGAASRVIWTVDFRDSNCELPTGGTAGRSPFSGFVGEANTSNTRITTNSSYVETHLNDGSATSITAEQAFPCEHTLSITPSLNCSYTVELDLTTDLTLATVAKRARGNSDDQTTTLIIVGTPFDGQNNGGNLADSNISDDAADSSAIDHDGDSSTSDISLRDAYFSHARYNGGVGAEENMQVLTDLRDGVPGETQFLNMDGEAILESSGNVVTAAGARVNILFNASDCDTPVRASNFRLHNAEPSGSIDFAVAVSTQGRCTPSAGALAGNSEGDVFAPEAGNPEDFEVVLLDSTCNYNLRVRSSNQIGFVSDAYSSRVSCAAGALIYELNSAGDLNSRVLLSTSRNGLNIVSEFPTEFIRRSSTGPFIVQIHLFSARNCALTAQVLVEYRVIGSSVDTTTDIRVNFVPTASSPNDCPTIPVTLRDASTSTRDNAVRVALTRRPRGSRLCSYIVEFPLGVASIQLVAEEGAADTNGDGTVDVVNQGGNRLRDTRTATTDNRFDGRYTLPALQSVNTETITFYYGVRRLPVTVVARFPTDRVFTTDDTVDFRVSVIGPCARFTDTFNSRFFGASGTFRSIQAFPGETLVFGQRLTNIRDLRAGSLNEIFEVEPLIVTNDFTGETAACTVQVSEASIPPGCSVDGGPTKEVTFFEGLTEYAFTFNHTCNQASLNPIAEDAPTTPAPPRADESGPPTPAPPRTSGDSSRRSLTG